MNKISKVFLTICISVLGVIIGSSGFACVPEYGGQYVEFVFEISGTVKNEDEEALEGIKIDHFDSGANTESDKKGDFDLKFSQGGSSLGSPGVNLNISDKTGVYKDKAKYIYVDCGENYFCKIEDIEIIMKKIGDETPDEQTFPDETVYPDVDNIDDSDYLPDTETDDESTDEE
jgi:hypothetical protein